MEACYQNPDTRADKVGRNVTLNFETRFQSN